MTRANPHPDEIWLAPQERWQDHWFGRVMLDANQRGLALLLILQAMRRRTRDDFTWKCQLDSRMPRLGDGCIIEDPENKRTLHAMYQADRLSGYEPTKIGTTAQIEGALRRCADRCKLTDEQRVTLFRWFNNWIQSDKAAKSNLEE